MIHEPLDFKRAVQLLMRRKIIMLAATALGLLVGVTFAVLRPPLLASQAWVVLPSSTRGGVGTQVLIAQSDAVLGSALRTLHAQMTVQSLRAAIHVESRTATIIAITAEGKTAADAKDTANAVARSYVDYVRNPRSLPNGPIQAHILQPAATASGTNSSSRLVGIGLLGAALGVVIAAFGILTVSRRDRRLWERDAIADSIGVPVIASLRVEHSLDAAGWRKLLKDYKPGAVDSWRMRKALQYLGMADLSASTHHGTGFTLTVVSGSFDRKALALGPQLAVFAASRGIPTALVIGPQPDVAATATLRTACATLPTEPQSQLRVSVTDHAEPMRGPDALLTIVVAVLDAVSGQAAHLTQTAATVLAVSAGTATAEQLAQIAASSATGGDEITGILVADPHPADTTTGRLPRVAGPPSRSRPRRMNGGTMEAGK